MVVEIIQMILMVVRYMNRIDANWQYKNLITGVMVIQVKQLQIDCGNRYNYIYCILVIVTQNESDQTNC